MAGSINKVILIGNVGKDPDVRHMQNGKEIAHLSIATSESWKDKATGERKEKTEWHRVVVMNDNLVNLVKSYITKGSKLYLEGSLQTRKWQNKDGVDQYSTEIVLAQYGGVIALLSGKEQGVDSHNQAKGNAYQPDYDPNVPF